MGRLYFMSMTNEPIISSNDPVDKHGLTQQDYRVIEVSIRAAVIQNSLGINQTIRNVVYAFALVNGPWTATNLADYLKIPRTNLLRILKGAESLGYWHKTDQGWFLNPEKKPLVIQYVRETSDILVGKRVSYSLNIVQAAGKTEPEKFIFHILDK